MPEGTSTGFIPLRRAVAVTLALPDIIPVFLRLSVIVLLLLLSVMVVVIVIVIVMVLVIFVLLDGNDQGRRVHC